MTAPAVSVIVPTYNRAALLAEAVASVRAQTFQDWELIVALDDGTTDGTAAMLAAIAEPRLRVLRIPHTREPARARNAALAPARGHWVAFLDDDDLWLPEKLATQTARLRETGARWSYTGFTSLGIDGRVKWRTPPERLRSGAIMECVLALRCAIALPTVMAERALVEEVGRFDESVPCREDYALSLSLAARAEAVAVPEALTTVRDHAGRVPRPGGYRSSVTLYRRWQRQLGDPALQRLCGRRVAQTLVAEGAKRLRALARAVLRRVGTPR